MSDNSNRGEYCDDSTRGEYYNDSIRGEYCKDYNNGKYANVCQLDGNVSCNSMETSDNETSENDSETESEQVSSSEEEEELETNNEDDGEENEENDDDEEHNTIPVIVGNRPTSTYSNAREPIRKTIKRSNALVEALSAPRISLYNVRSAWSKWNNIADDIEMRETDVCFLTEVWEMSENRNHQKAIESIFELRGIKYVSTPRPGARRGGGTALACSEQMFHITKLNISIPSPLEACFTLLKPKKPTGKIQKFICCAFYLPPRSKYFNKLAEFLISTLGRLRTEHPGCRVYVGGDRNDMKIGLLTSLDPTLKQIVTGFTNKNKNKVLDVFYTDCGDLMQEPEIIPPMKVDEGKVGKDSDHSGVQVLPRTNLAPKGTSRREKITVQRFPESRLESFGYLELQKEDWKVLEGFETTTSMVQQFELYSEKMVNNAFPKKEVLVGADDLPYYTEELRLLKRQKVRAYEKHGQNSNQYKNLKQKYKNSLKNEAIKYKNKIEREVSEGRRGSSYSAIRKLGNRPGEDWKKPEFFLPAYVEENLAPLQAVNRLADHFFPSVSQLTLSM